MELMEGTPRSSTTTLAGLTRRIWEKLATVFAILGLIDVTSQLVEWAHMIHQLVDKYRIVKTWLFDLLPFHVPIAWHDYIVFGSLLFSVTNAGMYPSKQQIFFLFILGVIFDTEGTLTKTTNVAPRQEDSLVITISSVVALIVGGYISWHVASWSVSFFFALVFFYILVFAVSLGFLWTWRWVLGTTALFAALVCVNEIYVRWIAPSVSG